MKPNQQSRNLFKILAVVQSSYYIVYGIWPVLHIESFEKISGPKVDRWLVKTVGLLITVVGAGVAVGGWRNQAPAELKTIAAGSAATLAAVDVYYVAKKRIAWTYLLDAIPEIGLFFGWLWLAGAERKKGSK